MLKILSKAIEERILDENRNCPHAEAEVYDTILGDISNRNAKKILNDLIKRDSLNFFCNQTPLPARSFKLWIAPVE